MLVKDRVPYVLTDPAKYAKGEVTADYTPLSYKISDCDGWADEFGIDPAFPNVQLPTEISSTYDKSGYGVYFWQWSEGTYALLVGGAVGSGRYAGARSCGVSCGPGGRGLVLRRGAFSGVITPGLVKGDRGRKPPPI